MIAAFALDRLDEDGGDFIRRRDAVEDRVLDLARRSAQPRSAQPLGGQPRGKATWWMSGTSGEKPRRCTSFEPDSDIAP